MKKSNTKKLALAGVLCAVAVVGSMFSFPVFGSKCAPVQHMVNVLCAVLLGPWYGVGAAFVASLLRNLLGLGSLMAFPGSMCGALLCGIVYHKTHKLLPTLIGEVFGTGIIGGLLAWPVAILFMGKAAGDIAFYAYIVPFLVSTVGGSIIAGIILFALEKNGTLKSMQNALNKFSFPVFGSKCAPVQHMVNVLCAVLLGPWYGVGAAFVASLLRNLLGLGSLMAFPGSMCGALLCGIVYHKTHKLLPTLIGEVFGTGIIGGLLAWPVAILFMGKAAGDIAFYAYIVPFLVSTVGGSIIAGIILFALEKNGTLKSMQNALNK